MNDDKGSPFRNLVLGYLFVALVLYLIAIVLAP